MSKYLAPILRTPDHLNAPKVALGKIEETISENFRITFKMNQLFCTLWQLFLFSYLFGQSTVDWTAGMGGASTDILYEHVVDGNNDIISCGYFSGTVDFDPGPGVHNLTPPIGTGVFVQKLNQNGNFIFAHNFGQGAAHAVTTDASDNIIITGSFSNTVDFDPGVGVFNLTSNGGGDIFVLKLDNNGNFIWAVSFGSVGGDVGKGIALDDIGDVYITGNYQNTVDFDPGGGTYNLTSNGVTDVVVLKLDASGNFSWAHSFGSTSGDQGESISIDNLNDVYITGGFQNTVDFDPGAGTHNLTSSGITDIFILKLDNAGNLIWAHRIGGVFSDVAWSVFPDTNFNFVYLTGQFQQTVDFNPGAGTNNLFSSGSNDVFILKLNSTGTYVWAKKIGSSSSDVGNRIIVDQYGNSYTSGQFQNTVDFDPNAGVNNISSAGSFDGFALKLNGSGNLLSAKTFGSTGADLNYSMFLNSSNYVLLGGMFSGTVDLDPGAGTSNVTSNGSYDFFISSWGPDVLPIELLDFFLEYKENYVEVNWSTLSEINNDHFDIQRSIDTDSWESIGIVSGAGNSNSRNNYYFIDEKPFTGTSFYRIKQLDYDGKWTYSPTAVMEINNPHSFAVKTYPNPAKNDIYFQSQMEIHSAELYNANGKKLKAKFKNMSNGKYHISSKDYTPGIYFLVIDDLDILKLSISK
jgi:hypothetical protein